MIVLDTNVLSELMKPAPRQTVEAWMASRPVTSLFTTTITEAEILYGISQFDAQIAAIALSRNAGVATRNVDDFEGCGIDVINPWRDS